MGIEWHTARFLLSSVREGAKFTRSVTLGRQFLNLTPAECQSVLAEFGFDHTVELATPVPPAKHYADGFLRQLGAETLATLDASDYEGATHIHDLNRPLDQGSPHVRSSAATFDMVFDGGTLEHVFNFPVAIKSAMELVRIGGHLIIQTPANNFCGHGFYQFSPELFYRVLSPENGFVIERMVAFECFTKSQWYQVADPAEIHGRVELVGGDQRVLLLLRARRTELKEIFHSTPQQSDYAAAWSSGRPWRPRDPKQESVRPGVLSRLSERFSAGVKWRAKRWLNTLGPKAPRLLLRLDARCENRRFALGAQEDCFRPIDR